jgi:hypothetical protein
MTHNSQATANTRPTCRHCARPLKRAQRDLAARTGRAFGLYADDTFCQTTCGYLWACGQLGVPSALGNPR